MMNSARGCMIFTQKHILKPLASVKYSNELPILNCENSLQKSKILQMFMK
jgi:hypothetical protein